MDEISAESTVPNFDDALDNLTDRELLMYLVARVDAAHERLDKLRDAIVQIGNMQQYVMDEADTAKAELQEMMRTFGSNPLKAIGKLMSGKAMNNG